MVVLLDGFKVIDDYFVIDGVIGGLDLNCVK